MESFAVGQLPTERLVKTTAITKTFFGSDSLLKPTYLSLFTKTPSRQCRNILYTVLILNVYMGVSNPIKLTSPFVVQQYIKRTLSAIPNHYD